VSTYGSARVRAGRARVTRAHARQRFAVGVAGGIVGQLFIGFLLGWILAGGFSLTVRLLSMIISSVIATPAMLSVGFALMLKPDARPFGGGILVGTAVATLALAVTWFLL